MSNTRGKTRREILTDAAKAAAAAGAAGLVSCFPGVGGQWPKPGEQCDDQDAGTGTPEPSPPVTPAVVEVYREDSIKAGTRATIEPAVVAEMLEAGLAALANEVRQFNSGQTAESSGASDANPWSTLLPGFQSGQRLGIKVNTLGVVVPTPFFIKALIANLRDKLPLDPANIVVWDRFLEDVTGHGRYTTDDLAGAINLGTLLRGPKEGESEDDVALSDGHGYGSPVCSAPRGLDETTGLPGHYPRVSRVLTHDTAMTINCLSFKTHNISGITGAIKSVYGIVHNPGEYHKEFNKVAHLLYAIPEVRKALPLTICDGIVGLTSGDPTRPANDTPKRILLAQDPVAMDSYIVDVMNQLRTKNSVPLDPAQLAWLDNAAAIGLGTRSYKLVQVT